VHVRKIHKVGNSAVVAIPGDMMNSLGLELGDFLDWDYGKPGLLLATVKINAKRVDVKKLPAGIEVHEERGGGRG
jgi:antitoxin component of MazEF toxin-antitoxin module